MNSLTADGQTRSLIEIHIAVLLFGLAGLFGKLISLPSSIIVLGRVFFASIALLLLVGVNRQSMALRERRDYWTMIVLGTLLAAHWTTFFESIRVSTVAIGLISCSTFPVFATFIEPYVFKERVKTLNMIVALVTVFGVLLVVPEMDFGNNVAQGVAWGLTAAFIFAVIAVINRKYVKKYPSQLIALYQDSVATIALLPFLILIRPVFQIEDVFLLVLLGVVFTALSHSLFIKGMGNVKTQTASVIASLEPVYGTLLAYVLLGELPAVRTVLGGAIILGAVFYSSLKARRPEVQTIVERG